MAATDDVHWVQGEGRERGSIEGEDECPSVIFLASTHSQCRCLQGNGWYRKGRKGNRKRSRTDRERWRGASAAGRTTFEVAPNHQKKYISSSSHFVSSSSGGQTI